MPEIQLVIRLDSEQLKQFRAACILRDSSPTKEIARLVGRQVHEWAVEDYVAYQSGHTPATKG